MSRMWECLCTEESVLHILTNIMSQNTAWSCQWVSVWESPSHPTPWLTIEQWEPNPCGAKSRGKRWQRCLPSSLRNRVGRVDMSLSMIDRRRWQSNSEPEHRGEAVVWLSLGSARCRLGGGWRLVDLVCAQWGGRRERACFCTPQVAMFPLSDSAS